MAEPGQPRPAVAAVITRWLDTDEWLKNLDLLCGLRPVADHDQLQAEWARPVEEMQTAH